MTRGEGFRVRMTWSEGFRVRMTRGEGFRASAHRNDRRQWLAITEENGGLAPITHINKRSFSH